MDFFLGLIFGLTAGSLVAIWLYNLAAAARVEWQLAYDDAERRASINERRAETYLAKLCQIDRVMKGDDV